MKKKSPYDYSIRYRVKSNIGVWGDWQEGFGIWQGIELVQKQISIVKRSQLLKTIEIELKHNGNLLNYKGEITGKSILYEAR